MGKPQRLDRKEAELRGRLAETAAALLLMAKGYHILARRYRSPQGEIDLVARKGTKLCFIEVKARKTHTEALEAVTLTAERRIIAAATAWISRRRALVMLDRRYDIITMAGFSLHHEKDAFRPEVNQRSINLGDLF